MIEKLLSDLSGSIIYFVGIKGTGMTALAEIFRARGAIVTGSDVCDKFYTDDILSEMGIPVFEGFKAKNLPESTALLVHSAAYSPETNPEIIEAGRRNLPILSYPEALGILSREGKAAAIAGVHGKTTTTAMVGTLIKEVGLAASVLTGSAAANFNGRSTMVLGDKYFVAETCEYKRNFLNFSPDYMIITSIEADHLDYYKDFDDVLSAFVEYAGRLSEGGRLIYCADDAGTVQAADKIRGLRSDLCFHPYGFTAEGDYRLSSYRRESGRQLFRLDKFENRDFAINVPGMHNILNSAAAAVLLTVMLDDENRGDEAEDGIASGLMKFRGTKRRSEIIGEAGGILVMDDYGHHPAAIKTTIDGIRDFYPDRRILVDFMSHTYSRTEALLDGFSKAFGSADVVMLHKIYASAREAAGTVTGRDLYDKTCGHHSNVSYFEEVMDAWDFLEQEIRPGDLFVTMGAGDNWKLGYRLYEKLTENQQGCAE
ncbi:MAG: UDP-N-acetylmuramate--L-alanine ligase [Spirochaetales bacterium]|nr:UDP-N-acetylmuramate--L-alanine ligase [Spirochaetales bacterium]